MSSRAGGPPPFIAVIPSRRASTRLPGKALADIAGLPMVVHVAKRAAASGASRVLVATDDEEIAGVVRSHGFEAMMTSASHPSGTDRIAEVAGRLDLDAEEIVVNVQGDEPLVDPRLIARAAATLAASADCAIATACHRIASTDEFGDPNVVKLVTDRAGRALYFSRAPIPWPRDTGVDPGAMRHIGLYAYRAGFLAVFASLEVAPIETTEALEQLRALWHGYRIAVFETDEAPSPGVDTPSDLARVRALITAAAPRD